MGRYACVFYGVWLQAGPIAQTWPKFAILGAHRPFLDALTLPDPPNPWPPLTRPCRARPLQAVHGSRPYSAQQSVAKSVASGYLEGHEATPPGSAIVSLGCGVHICSELGPCRSVGICGECGGSWRGICLFAYLSIYVRMHT